MSEKQIGGQCKPGQNKGFIYPAGSCHRAITSYTQGYQVQTANIDSALQIFHPKLNALVQKVFSPYS